MIKKIQKMNDDEWVIKKSTLIKEIRQGMPLYKKLRLQFCFVRVGYTNFMSQTTIYILQDLQFEIAEFEDYEAFFMRKVEPAHLTHRIFMDGTLIYINAIEASSQPLCYNVACAKSAYHTKISKVGKPVIITKESAERMLKNKEIFCTLQGDLATSRSQTVNIYQRSR